MLIRADRKTVLEASMGYREGALVVVKGIIQRDRVDRQKFFDAVEHVTHLDPLDIEIRLGELAQLRDGWLDGKGLAPDRDGLQRLATLFDDNYAPELPLPYLYPTAEGGVQAEWTLDRWELSMEIRLPDLSAQLQTVDPGSGECREFALQLMEDAGWHTLNAAIKDIQESQA